LFEGSRSFLLLIMVCIEQPEAGTSLSKATATSVRGPTAGPGHPAGAAVPGRALTKGEEKEFEEMLNAMNLPAQARGPMLLMPAQQKLDLLRNHKEKEKSLKVRIETRFWRPCALTEWRPKVGDKSGKVKNSPQFVVNQLQTPDAQTLQASERFICPRWFPPPPDKCARRHYACVPRLSRSFG
jgi:hypothetical protein